MIHDLRTLVDESTQAIKTEGLPIKETPARIIGFTGLDGSGKTGTRNAIAEYLHSKGAVVVTCKSPCDPHMVAQLNNLLKQNNPYAAQLMFTYCDHLLSAYMERLRFRCDYILAQRGPIDQYVHGLVRGKGQGFKEIYELQRPELLVKYDAYVHMNCEPATAWERIKDDPDKDVYEYPEYIEHQSMHIRDLYNVIKDENIEELQFCSNAQHFYVVTTKKTEEETAEYVLGLLKATGLIPL